jgi:methyl-accepting chemotaxis protein
MSQRRLSVSPQSVPAGGGFGEFFRYHGWLAPGVRLFRGIGFPAKAAWVALAFLIPLILTLAMLWRGTQAQVDVADSERQGVAYVRPLLELIEIGQLRRQAAMGNSAELGALQEKTKAAFAKVQAQQDTVGVAFRTTDEFKSLQVVHEQLLAAPASANPDRTFKLHALFVGSALNLLGQLSNGSQLALDPDEDTYHMMNVAVLRGPVQAENTARLRGLGTLVLGTKELTQARRDQLSKWLAIWDFVDGDVKYSYNVAAQQAGETKIDFDMAASDAAATSFKEAISQQVLGAEAIVANPADFKALGDAAVGKQVDMVHKLLDRLDTRLQQRIDRLRSALFLELGVALFFVLLAAYLLMAFYKVMMGGLAEVAGHLKQITAGNLTTAPRPWGRDEAAGLMTTLGEMQASLRRIVGVVVESASGVQTASAEISSATHDLSRRTEQSAASLEETAASTEQISATARNTASTVDGAMAIVQNNAQAATRGGQVIGEVVNTMGDIRTASNRIGEIIGVIDGIAFQTNILALNAAVEAARAGEQGRGFAVVATEVRALAGRSAAAAKEIKTLIAASLDKVESGTKVVAHAGQTMGEIVHNAERIGSLMRDISTATREQSAGVGQVGSAVQELDQATQQNAALVEQTAAATSMLSEQAERLSREISFFRVPPAGRPA